MPQPESVPASTATNWDDWHNKPELARFMERVHKVFPGESDAQLAIDALQNNMRYSERPIPQDLKNFSMGWFHYVDHAYGGVGPRTFTHITVLDACIPKESKSAHPVIDPVQWLYFVVMMRSNANIECRMVGAKRTRVQVDDPISRCNVLGQI